MWITPASFTADAVGLVSATLAWGFQRPGSTATRTLSAEQFAGRAGAGGADPAADLVAARAPDSWLAVVHAAPLRQWLVRALGVHASAAAAARRGAADCALASQLRQVLIQMCLLGPWDARGGGSTEVAEVGVHGLLEV